MKRGFCLTLAIAILTAMSSAQVVTDPASAAPPNQGPSAKPQNPGPVPTGSVLSVELSKSLDTKKLKADDKIEARTATDMLQHGQIVVPRNTKVVGHVTEAKAHSKTSPGSTVGITFDRMLLKDGREVPLQLTVQAIGRPLPMWSSATGGPSADNPAGAPTTMPGRATMSGPSSTSGGAAPYPGASDPGSPLDPRDSSNSTVSPLSPTSRGVVGIKGLSMDTSGPAARLNSSTGNVHLDTGTQLILRVQ